MEKNKIVGIRMSGKQVVKLKKLAYSHGLTLSEFVRVIADASKVEINNKMVVKIS